jgi:holo-[acyl-carrier protein] synthase
VRIYGIGTDIVSVERMEQGLERFGERFAQRLLAPAELEEYPTQSYPARYLAKRFAAKEAAVKALGTGFRDGITLSQIQISHDELGKPLLEWHGVARQQLEINKISQSYISISDEKHMAVAFVTLCCD